MKKTLFFIAILAKTATATATATATESTLSNNLLIKNVRIADKKITRLANRVFDRQLFIRSNGRIKNILSHISKEYYTDDYLQEILNQKNKIAAVNITTYGMLSQSNGAKNYHEVASCVFINVVTGCIISRESSIACSGKWIGEEMWETDQGEKIDMAVLKNSILSKTTADTDLLKNENFDLCKKQF